jgi:putative tryptophan/tyrosine transport system substrate-binding protein
MRRRDFLYLVGGATAFWPEGARAQPSASKIARLGLLSPARSDSPAESLSTLNAFIPALSALGYAEGQNILIERKWAGGNIDSLKKLAAELVQARVDVIVAISTPAARAAKNATTTIPIVGIAMGDPVQDELVSSLARPGGNVTGTAFLGPELVAKRLQLLKEVIPTLSKVAVLWHAAAYGGKTMSDMKAEIESAARALKIELVFENVEGPRDVGDAFAAMVRQKPDGFVVFPSPMLYGEYKQIVGLAAEHHLPGIYAAREGVELGGLLSYGVNLSDLSRQTAPFVDKILKGAKPAELPVEQPTKFELLINLKTAKILGLNVSRDFLLITDEVIE